MLELRKTDWEYYECRPRSLITSSKNLRQLVSERRFALVVPLPREVPRQELATDLFRLLELVTLGVRHGLVQKLAELVFREELAIEIIN